MSDSTVMIENGPDAATRQHVGIPSRRFRTDALHVLTLFTLAWAQPVLEVHGAAAWFFVADRVPSVDIVLLAALLCFLLPSLLVVLEALAGLLSQKLRNALHAVLVYGLLLLLAYLTAARLSDFSSRVTLATAWGLAAIGVLSYLRFKMVQFFVTCLSLGLLVIPANFLWQTGVVRAALTPSAPNVLAGGVNADTPVVMLVFDEFPLTSLLDSQRQIDRAQYPNFAALADDAYWFRNATTVSDRTHNAVPAILSGRYPNPGLLPTAKDYPDNLFTLLGTSYEMHVQEPITHLCPDRLCPETRKSLAERARWLGWAVLGTRLPHAVVDPARPSIYSTFLESISSASEATLYFEHSVLPHAPWWYLPSGKAYSLDGKIDGLAHDEWVDDDWLVTQGYQRHLLQARYADALLGDLVQRLKSVDLYDRALVVVVADHGASFRAGQQRRQFSSNTIADIMPVPLLIKLPHQTEGAVSDRNVQTIDILPTIADVLDIDVSWDVDGHSVFDASQEAPEKILFNQSGERFAFGPEVDGVDAAVRHKLALFGIGDDPDGLFQIGRYRDLYGRPVDALPMTGTSNLTLELDREADFAEVDLSSDFIPARITGRMQSPSKVGEPVWLAIAVNGTVRAMTRTFVDGDTTRFAAMVPEASFRAGANEVEVFLVSGSEENPELQRIERVHASASGGS